MALQIVELSAWGIELSEPLGDFLEILRDAGDEEGFHPHPLTRDEAARRVRYKGRDLYYALINDGRVLAYGMLRGWDDGYTVPSLGIAVHPAERGKGLSKLMMLFLHAAARRQMATRVRLTVDAGNIVALRLYCQLGYEFRQLGKGRLEGFAEL